MSFIFLFYVRKKLYPNTSINDFEKKIIIKQKYKIKINCIGLYIIETHFKKEKHSL